MHTSGTPNFDRWLIKHDPEREQDLRINAELHRKINERSQALVALLTKPAPPEQLFGETAEFQQLQRDQKAIRATAPVQIAVSPSAWVGIRNAILFIIGITILVGISYWIGPRL